MVTPKVKSSIGDIHCLCCNQYDPRERQPLQDPFLDAKLKHVVRIEFDQANQEIIPVKPPSLAGRVFKPRALREEHRRNVKFLNEAFWRLFNGTVKVQEALDKLNWTVDGMLQGGITVEEYEKLVTAGVEIYEMTKKDRLPDPDAIREEPFVQKWR